MTTYAVGPSKRTEVIDSGLGIASVVWPSGVKVPPGPIAKVRTSGALPLQSGAVTIRKTPSYSSSIQRSRTKPGTVVSPPSTIFPAGSEMSTYLTRVAYWPVIESQS